MERVISVRCGGKNFSRRRIDAEDIGLLQYFQRVVPKAGEDFGRVLRYPADKGVYLVGHFVGIDDDFGLLISAVDFDFYLHLSDGLLFIVFPIICPEGYTFACLCLQYIL